MTCFFLSFILLDKSGESDAASLVTKKIVIMIVVVCLICGVIIVICTCVARSIPTDNHIPEKVSKLIVTTGIYAVDC